MLRSNLVIDEIREQQIHTAVLFHLLHALHNPDQGLRAYPVVTVHNLVVKPGRIAQSGIHRLAVAAVLLMHSPDNARILRCIAVRDLRRPVLRRAVVDNQDLNILSSREE